MTTPVPTPRPRERARRGPEVLSLPERIIAWTRLPYAVGCVVLGLVIGAPGYLLIAILETGSLTQALDQVLSNPYFTIGGFGQRISLAEGIAESTLFTLFLILTLYFIRYMRLQMLAVEPEVAHLTPRDPEAAFHRAFGGSVSLGYSLLLAAGFTVLYLPARVLTPTGPVVSLSAIILLPMDFVFIGIALWVYLRALWGIYTFGKEELSLRPFTEDRMLGLQPLGSISLSFSVVVLTLVVIALVGSFVSADLANLLVQFSLLVLLAVMLFMPLYGIHRKMLVARKREQAWVQERLAEAAEREPGGGEAGALLEIKTLLSFRMLKEEASKIPTWPFDVGRLERFIAVFLSVTAVVIARLILAAFNF